MKNRLKNSSVLRSNYLRVAMIAFILSLAQFTSAQQSIGFTLLHPVCNNDGVLVMHDTTGTLPVTFHYNYGGQYVSDYSATGYDTIVNFNGSSLSVYCVDAANAQQYGYFNGALPINFYDSTTNAVCPALGTAHLYFTSGTAPYTVSWINQNGTTVATGNPASLPGGMYDVLITDAAGCTVNTADLDSNYRSIYVGSISSIVLATNTTVANCTNGTATVTSATGGNSPYSYLWSNGANSAGITGLGYGSYVVTVTDAQGCNNSAYLYVQQAISINAHTTVTNATCIQNDGSVIAFGSGGMSPYTYSWSTGQQTPTISNLATNQYTVTVTDANHCAGVGYAYVSATTPITVTYSSTPSSCTAPTGTATVAPTGGTAPYTVTWQTYPAQTGLTATNLPQGTFGFTVRDAVGCIRGGSVYVPPISIIYASTSVNNAMCTQANGSAAMNVSGGTSPFTYVWSNGATTSSISSLTAGSYSCTVTDHVGCAVTKTADVLAATSIGIGLNSQQASCIYAHDGSITSSVYGGTAPYTYRWSDGQTTSNATGLAANQYYLYVTDAAGCSQHAWSQVGYDVNGTSCYCTITGKVFVDSVVANCQYDAGEQTVQNIMIHCAGFGYAFTDANGVYSFKVPTGTYTLSEEVQSYYPLAACQNNLNSITVTAASGCTNTIDFANVINPIHDVMVYTTDYYSHAIPGFSFQQRWIVANQGTLTETGIDANYKHDGQLSFNSSSPALTAGSTANRYTLTPSLTPGGFEVVDINYDVPTNIPLGTSVLFEDTAAYTAPLATNWLDDYSPWDNVNSFTEVVVGSFDPNYKEVSPKGTTTHGYIANTDSILTYTIHFQNTGSYPAQKVVVIDTLDKDLDIASLRLGYSSHQYVASMSDSGVLTFTFDNIQLPTSSNSPIASNGLVMYTIHHKANLASNTEIKSPANIYFDYNAPVATNTALNTIKVVDSTHTAIAELDNNGFNFLLYPNPANTSVSIAINCDEASNSTFRIYNMLGEVMQAKALNLQQGRNTINTNISNLTSGFYFVEISDGHQTKQQKLSVIK